MRVKKERGMFGEKLYINQRESDTIDMYVE